MPATPDARTSREPGSAVDRASECLDLLFLSHRIPYPPDKGDKIRSYHELVGLAERGHRVTLATFVDDPEDLRHVEAVRALCEEAHVQRIGRRMATLRGLAWLGLGGSLSIGFYRSREFRRWIASRSAARAFDAVFAFSSTMAPYALAVPGDPVRVLDLVDLDSEKWSQYASRFRPPRSWLLRLESRRLRRIEVDYLSRFDHCVVCTEPERETLEGRGNRPVRVIPNGVSLDRFPFVPPRGREPIVIFTGAMDYFPNVDGVDWFAREVFPEVRSRCPGARFRIVGRNPAPKVVALDELDGVEVVGGVPDMADELHRGRVAVAPLRIARGVQNKVLEAMCAGTPVVASEAAFEGIEARAGEEVRVGSTGTEIAALVIELLNDESEGEALARRARAAVERAYSWSRSVDRIEELLRRA